MEISFGCSYNPTAIVSSAFVSFLRLLATFDYVLVPLKIRSWLIPLAPTLPGTFVISLARQTLDAHSVAFPVPEITAECLFVRLFGARSRVKRELSRSVYGPWKTSLDLRIGPFPRISGVVLFALARRMNERLESLYIRTIVCEIGRFSDVSVRRV